MGTRFLVDTCTIINYIDNSYSNEVLQALDEIFDNETIISFITQIEMLAYNPSNYDDIMVRENFVKHSKIEYIDEDIIKDAIYIRREAKIKLPDAIIAATAKHYDYTLLSSNFRDFKKVTSLGVKYINPENLTTTN